MIGMMVTVIADYSRDSTRGKANGLQGVVATLGAFLPPMLGACPNCLSARALTNWPRSNRLLPPPAAWASSARWCSFGPCG